MEAPKLNWAGTIFVGSSSEQAVVGKKNGGTIVVPATSEWFDSMVCTDKFYELNAAYNDLIKKCEKWRSE